MLTIKDPDDLVKYLEARRDMAKAQTLQLRSDRGLGPGSPLPSTIDKAVSHSAGMEYAFGEAIKAVRAMVAGAEPGL